MSATVAESAAAGPPRGLTVPPARSRLAQEVPERQNDGFAQLVLAALGELGLGHVTLDCYGPFDRYPATATATATDPARPHAEVRVDGVELVVGPVRSAGGSANAGCGHCVQLAWSDRRAPATRQASSAQRPPRHAGRPLLSTAAVLVAARIACRLAAAEQPAGDPQIVTRTTGVDVLDADELAVRQADVPTHAGCAACRLGPLPGAEDAVAVPDGASRQRGPAAYGLRPADFVDAAVGVLGAGFLPGELASPLACRCGGEFDTPRGPVQWSGVAARSRSARLVGVLEGLERVAGGSPTGRLTTVHGSFEELAQRAVDPRHLGLPGADTLAADPGLVPYRADEPAEWVAARSMVDARALLVPQLRVFDNPTDGPLWWRECSNGAASGASAVEARLFGLLEVLERDAALVAWHRGEPLPEIDPDELDSPLLRADLARLARYGWRARFLDAGAEHCVPVVVVLVETADGPPRGIGLASAAGLSALDAMHDALQEAALLAPKLERVAALDGARLRHDAAITDPADHWRRYALPEFDARVDFLREPAGGVTIADVEARLPRPATDLAAVLEHVAASVVTDCAEAEDVLAVELTTRVQAEAGLRCVKAIVPGLLPFDFITRGRAPSLPRWARLGCTANPEAHPYA